MPEILVFNKFVASAFEALVVECSLSDYNAFRSGQKCSSGQSDHSSKSVTDYKTTLRSYYASGHMDPSILSHCVNAPLSFISLYLLIIYFALFSNSMSLQLKHLIVVALDTSIFILSSVNLKNITFFLHFTSDLWLCECVCACYLAPISCSGVSNFLYKVENEPR